MGFDSSVQKWRPWDNYERRIYHQCSGNKIQESVTINKNNELVDELNSIRNNQASIMRMLQNIAAKLGVEEQSEQ